MKKYSPLIIALIIIFGMTLFLCNIFQYPIFSKMGMNMLMGSWFIVFGATKLMDVSGFVASFRQYDILTKKIPLYGYAYPVIEFTLGVVYVLDQMMSYWIPTNIATILISSLTTIGIVRSFSNPTKIHCACLGANTQLTLGWITLVESTSMVIMALVMILWML